MRILMVPRMCLIPILVAGRADGKAKGLGYSRK